MPIWDKVNKKPQSWSREEKRNIIITDIGFVRRQRYTDQHSNARVKDEILETISGLANSTNWGVPFVTDMWFQPNTGVIEGDTVNTFVTFSEPVKANTGLLKIDVANTAAGNNMIAYNLDTTTYIANNTIKFSWVPDTAGTYKVEAQTIGNTATVTGQKVRSLNATKETASLVIGGTVSNTAGSLVVESA